MTERKPLIVANWKMCNNLEQSIQFVARLPKVVEGVEIVICPPFTSLYSVSIALSEGIPAFLGAQNCHWEDEGAFTGEISPLFLNDCQCSFVLIGHSERRELFKETDDMLAKKVVSVLKHGMTPIFCVGESIAIREQGKTIEHIYNQLEIGLKNISREDFLKIVIAYEPVWAIGTGNTATPEIAEEVHVAIRKWVFEKGGIEAKNNLRILYGGSVKPNNILSLMKQENIDGALVGSASVDVDSFLEIISFQK